VVIPSLVARRGRVALAASSRLMSLCHFRVTPSCYAGAWRAIAAFRVKAGGWILFKLCVRDPHQRLRRRPLLLLPRRLRQHQVRLRHLVLRRLLQRPQHRRRQLHLLRHRVRHRRRELRQRLGRVPRRYRGRRLCNGACRQHGNSNGGATSASLQIDTGLHGNSLSVAELRPPAQSSLP
jgi:hypothetical protein